MPQPNNNDRSSSGSPRINLSLPPLSIAGYLVFAIMTVLVQVRALADMDYVIASAIHSVSSGILDVVAAGLSIAVSAEFSVFYAVVASLVLWRLGFGPWSITPCLFLLLVPIEFAMKSVIDQPVVPDELRRHVGYPLTTIASIGSFPSGHSVRTGFFCGLLAVLLRSYRGRWVSAGYLALVVLVVAVWFTRIYLGSHWSSDVVAGVILGGATALTVGTRCHNGSRP